MINVIKTALDGVLIIEPAVHGDHRGYFMETYSRADFEAAGITNDFVQDNESMTMKKGTIRGIHFQLDPMAQAKTVRVVSGALRDIAVDLRKGSETYGNKVKCKVVKNKVAPPFKVAEFDIIYGKGISKVGEVLDIGTDVGVIQKSGSFFSYNGEKLGQGKEKAKAALEADPKLLAEIEAKIKAKSDDIDLTADPEEAYSLEDDEDDGGDEFDIRVLDVSADDDK